MITHRQWSGGTGAPTSALSLGGYFSSSRLLAVTAGVSALLLASLFVFGFGGTAAAQDTVELRIEKTAPEVESPPDAFTFQVESDCLAAPVSATIPYAGAIMAAGAFTTIDVPAVDGAGDACIYTVSELPAAGYEPQASITVGGANLACPVGWDGPNAADECTAEAPVDDVILAADLIEPEPVYFCPAGELVGDVCVIPNDPVFVPGVYTPGVLPIPDVPTRCPDGSNPDATPVTIATKCFVNVTTDAQVAVFELGGADCTAVLIFADGTAQGFCALLPIPGVPGFEGVDAKCDGVVTTAPATECGSLQAAADTIVSATIVTGAGVYSCPPPSVPVTGNPGLCRIAQDPQIVTQPATALIGDYSVSFANVALTVKPTPTAVSPTPTAVPEAPTATAVPPEPTAVPTEPTVEPTAGPTADPTADPEPTAVVAPTAVPTAGVDPTVVPTEAPQPTTAAASATATPSVTAVPTATEVPAFGNPSEAGFAEGIDTPDRLSLGAGGAGAGGAGAGGDSAVVSTAAVSTTAVSSAAGAGGLATTGSNAWRVVVLGLVLISFGLIAVGNSLLKER